MGNKEELRRTAVTGDKMLCAMMTQSDRLKQDGGKEHKGPLERPQVNVEVVGNKMPVS